MAAPPAKAAPSATAAANASKLPAIPQSNPGEPPYFIMVYRKRNEASRAAKNEAAMIADQLAWAGAMVFKVKKFRSHYFRWNERLCALREQLRISAMATQAAWEPFHDVVREFGEAVAAHAEVCVTHVHRFFKGRAVLPQTVVPLDDDPRSFVVRDAGILVHVWASHTQAKLFIAGQLHIAQCIRDLRTEAIATPLTVLHCIAGTYVTCTALSPLTSATPIDTSKSPLVSHAIDEVEVLSRARTPIRLWQGADGRLHALDSLPAAHLHSDSPPVDESAVAAQTSETVAMASGDLNLAMQPRLAHYHPNVNVTVPKVLDEAMYTNIGAAAADLLEIVMHRAGGNMASVRGVVKVIDLIEEGTVASVLHRHGVKLRMLFRTMSHPSLRGTEAGSVVRELLLSEMVGRTMKAIVRADLHETPSAPPERGSTAVGHAFVTDIVNRCVYAILVRKEFWDPHFMPILRAKYGCPDEFGFKQEIVAKRVVVTFLRMHFGAIFEGGKFTKMTAVLRSHTVATASPELTRCIDGNKQDVHEQLATRWKDVLVSLQEPSLKVCAMVADLVLAAACKAPVLLKHAGQLTSLLDQIDDEAVNVVVKFIIMECLQELNEQTAFLMALAKYRDNCLLPLGSDSVPDSYLIGHRYRLCGNLLLASDKRQKADAGALYTSSARYFMVCNALHEPILPDTVFSLYLDALRHNLVSEGADIYETYGLANRIVQTLVAAMVCDLDRRREKVIDILRYILARLISLPQDFPAEGREIFFHMAEKSYELHRQHIASDADTRRQTMLLILCAHSLGMRAGQLTSADDKENLRSFREATEKVEAALASDQKGMLRADWMMPRYGPIAALLQRFRLWGLSKGILDMVHGFCTAGQFKSTVHRAAKTGGEKPTTTADAVQHELEEFRNAMNVKYGSSAAKVIPDLTPPTDRLITAVTATFRIQLWHRDIARKRQELARKREEEKDLLEKQEQVRAERIAARLPLRDIVTAASIVADLSAKRFATPQVPPMLPLHAPRLNSGFALQTLIGVAKPRSCISLCTIMVQSELMPPIKWAVQPAGPGARAIAVCPATSSLVHWFNERWLTEVDWYVGDEHPSVAAKRARSMRRMSTMSGSFAAAKRDERKENPFQELTTVTSVVVDDTGQTPEAKPADPQLKNVSFDFRVINSPAAADACTRTKTFLFAKIFAVFIYSQSKYSFLKWILAGNGFAAPVVELLATMLPQDTVHALVTFGGLPAFGDFAEEVPKVAHAHVFHRRDLIPFLPMHPWIAERPEVFDVLTSRIIGCGVVMPTLEGNTPSPISFPTYDFLQRLAHYSHVGAHRHVLWSHEEQATIQEQAPAEKDSEDDRRPVEGDPPEGAATQEQGDQRQQQQDTPQPRAPEEPQVLQMTGDDTSAPDGPAAIALPSDAQHEDQSQPAPQYLVSVKSDPIRFLDLRIVVPNVSMQLYHAALLNAIATDRAIEHVKSIRATNPKAAIKVEPTQFGFMTLPQLPTTPHLRRISKYLDPFGRAKTTLNFVVEKNSICLPMTVEPVVATVEQLLMTYPKLGVAIVTGATFVPDSYGGLPNFDFAARMEKASVLDSDLAAILDSVKGASWDSKFVAEQLFELSACGMPVDEPAQTQPSHASPSKSRRVKIAVSQNQPTVNSLYMPLLESFVERHNFVFSVPLKAKQQVDEPPPEVPAPVEEIAQDVPEAVLKDVSPSQKDTIEAALSRPDGYHVGWCVAVASTVRGVGKSTVIQQLVNCDIRGRGVAKMQTTVKAVDVPFVRLSWQTSATPSLTEANLPRHSPPRNAETVTIDDDSESVVTETTALNTETAAPLDVGLPPGHVVQLHFQEVKFDGKRASQLLMQCAAQCIWVVSDKYSLDALTRSDAIGKYSNILNSIAYNPRGAKTDPEVLDAVKKFALARAIPFAVVEDASSASILLQSLIHWMLPSIRLPLNPQGLPANIELGSLSSLDAKVIESYIAAIQQRSSNLTMLKRRIGTQKL
jgi:hypothetical protein